MEHLDAIITAVFDWFGRTSGQVADAGQGGGPRLTAPALAVLLAVPVLLALASRRLLAVAGVLLLAWLTWLSYSGEAAFAALATPALYASALLVASMGVASARRHRQMRAELAALRADVDRLKDAESRRFLADLKSPAAEAQQDVAP